MFWQVGGGPVYHSFGLGGRTVVFFSVCLFGWFCSLLLFWFFYFWEFLWTARGCWGVGIGGVGIWGHLGGGRYTDRLCTL